MDLLCGIQSNDTKQQCCVAEKEEEEEEEATSEVEMEKNESEHEPTQVCQQVKIMQLPNNKQKTQVFFFHCRRYLSYFCVHLFCFAIKI